MSPPRENAFPKPCMLSIMETFHTHIIGYPQKDDQLKQWDCHITPSTE